MSMYGGCGNCADDDTLIVTHKPGAVLDYGFIFTDRLTAGETISTSTWAIIAPLNTTEITLPNPQVTDGITSVFVSGGVAGTDYEIRNTVVTSLRTYVCTLIVQCRGYEAC